MLRRNAPLYEPTSSKTKTIFEKEGVMSKEYQEIISRLQYLTSHVDKLTQDQKIMQLRMISQLMKAITDLREVKAVARALVHFGVADDSAVLQVGVYYPRLEEEDDE